MSNSNNPPVQGGVAKRKRGRPRKVPLDGTPAPVVKSRDSRSSSASGSNKNRTELETHLEDLIDAGETESLFEDIIGGLDEENYEAVCSGSSIEPCTPEESAHYRQMLRAIGPEELCRRTVDAGTITAKRLLTAFGVPPPPFLEGEPDESYFGLLSLALGRELRKRAKLTEYNSVDDAVRLLKKSRNIVVLTGAGISTSLGIPDFRSKNTGLYERLAHLEVDDPQDVFDIDRFKENPTIFYSVARDILPSTSRFTPTHAFIAMLQTQGKLLTNYTQNIDNLEAKAGIVPSKLVQCHGSFATATCVTCRYRVVGDTIFPTIKAGEIPMCPKCNPPSKPRGGSSATAAAAVTAAARRQRKALARESSTGTGSLSRSNSFDNVTSAASTPPTASRGRGRPRGRPPGKVGRPRGRRNKRRGSFDDDDDDDDEGDDIYSGRGIMKPDITFFGEELPDEFGRRLTDIDRDKADLIVVIGTSLKVTPVSEIPAFMPPHVPAIYISREPVKHLNFDIDLLGDCDVVVSELCRRAGWDLSHEMIPPNQQIRIEPLVGEHGSQHKFTDVTPGLIKKETVASVTTAIGAQPFVPKATVIDDQDANVMQGVEDYVDPNATDDDNATEDMEDDAKDTIEVEDIDDFENGGDAEDVDEAGDTTELSVASTSIAVATPADVKTGIVTAVREVHGAQETPGAEQIPEIPAAAPMLNAEPPLPPLPSHLPVQQPLHDVNGGP